MIFAKKTYEMHWLSRAMFVFSYGFLVSFFFMIFGTRLGFFHEGVPTNSLGLSFIVGTILGWLLENIWKKMHGLNRELVTSLVLFLFTAFASIVGLAVGSSLGGNGIVVFDWAGLQGYESVGLVAGCIGAFFGLWIATRALTSSTKKTPWILLANGVVLLVLLLAGDATQNPNLTSLSVLAMPALTLVLHYGFKF